MKIKILGSGGGEGFPAAFCSCEHCELVRKVGGKSLRSLSQTLIGDDLLIDFPVDTESHCVKYGINLGKIQNFLITHTHEDHYVPLCVSYRGGWGAHNLKYEKMKFFGPKNLEEIFNLAIVPYGISTAVRNNVEFVVLEDKNAVNIGEYLVTPLNAYHVPSLGSLNYIIEKDGKSLLYLLDSGYPTEETMEYMQSRNQVFDAVIMDATMGISHPKRYIYHMCFDENKALKEEMLNKKLANEKTRFVITHITHNNAETHESVEEIFKGTNIEVAYDGFEFEI